MSQVFISYSRVDTAFVDVFIRRLQRAFPDLKIWYDQVPHGLIGGGNWWNDILNAVAASDVFIYILSNESVNSLYCQAEFTEARRLQKSIITIQARDHTELTKELDDIQYINMKDGVDSPEAFPNLVAAINLRLKEAEKLPNLRPLRKLATPKPSKEPPLTRTADSPTVETPPLAHPSAEEQALCLQRRAVFWQIISVIVGIIAILVTILVALPAPPNNGNVSPAPTSLVQASAAPSETPPLSPMMTETPVPTSDPAVTSTLSGFQQLQTAQMQLTHSASTQAATDLTATQDIVLSVNATGTAQQIEATEAAARVTFEALSWTPTQTPSSATEVSVQATTGSFTPHLGNFEGFTFAFVPSDRNQIAYWIMKYEVTNDAFAGYMTGRDNRSDEGFFRYGESLPGARLVRSGNNWTVESIYGNHPVMRVSWYGARDFCLEHGFRLPNDQEWWQAAVWNPPTGERYQYPWGNSAPAREFAVYEAEDTQPVDAMILGQSPIGSLNMVGNAAEWISNTTGNQRGYTGGSWQSSVSQVGISVIIRSEAQATFSDVGFRCVRDE